MEVEIFTPFAMGTTLFCRLMDETVAGEFAAAPRAKRNDIVEVSIAGEWVRAWPSLSVLTPPPFLCLARSRPVSTFSPSRSTSTASCCSRTAKRTTNQKGVGVAGGWALIHIGDTRMDISKHFVRAVDEERMLEIIAKMLASDPMAIGSQENNKQVAPQNDHIQCPLCVPHYSVDNS